MTLKYWSTNLRENMEGIHTFFLIRWSDAHVHTRIRSHILYLQYENQLILYVPSLVRHYTSYFVTVNLLYNVCTYYRIYQNYSSPINTYPTLKWHTIHTRLFFIFMVLVYLVYFTLLYLLMQWYIILICMLVYTGWLRIKYPTRQYATSPQPVVWF